MATADTTQTNQLVGMLPTQFPTLRLLYTSGTGVSAGRAVTLRNGSLAIGREVGEGDIGLPGDSRASRVHAHIHLTAPEQRVYVVDAKSKNGTFVNGCRVDQSPLADGDIIRVGNSFLLLRFEPISAVDGRSELLVGSSPAIRTLRSEVSRMAKTPATVLLLGESGSGKEVAAQALHKESNASGRFVAINCSAIPESLAESQLFGHNAGAFSGAKAAQEGYFEAAQGGTLFLDEIGEMPLSIQPKLLRTLEERAVTPVGSTKSRSVNVRVLAATNRDLRQAIEAGKFRGDLYARLAEVIIQLPPLRARREDILPLLMCQFAPKIPVLAPDLVEALLLYHWPYNVRELLKIAATLRAHADGASELTLAPVASRLQAAAPSASPAVASATAPTSSEVGAADRGETESPSVLGPPPSKQELEELLRIHQGKILQVAKAVRRSRRQVARWLESYLLDRKDFVR